MQVAPTIAAAAIGSSLCWSALDALRKKLGEGLDATTLVALFSLGQAPIFVAWWLLAPSDVAHAAYWPPALTCLALNIVANLLFVRSVQVSELSVVVPLLSFTPVFSTLAAIPMLGERPEALEAAGISVVVLGALVLGHQRREDGRRVWRDPGVWMMLGVAAAWSMTTVLDKAATAHAPGGLHGLVQTAGMGLILAASLRLRGRPFPREAVRAQAGRLVFAVAAAGAAFALQLVALRGLDAGLVETQKRVIGLVMALVLGRILFEEAITPRKQLGVVILALGTALTVLGAA